MRDNTFMAELQNRIVPFIVQHDVFWTRYFYQCVPLLTCLWCMQAPLPCKPVQPTAQLSPVQPECRAAHDAAADCKALARSANVSCRLHKLEAKHAQRQQLAARASRASMEDISWDDEESAAQPGALSVL